MLAPYTCMCRIRLCAINVVPQHERTQREQTQRKATTQIARVTTDPLYTTPPKRCDMISCGMCPTSMLQHILVGERTSMTSQDELPSASVVQPSVRGDALQESIKEHKCCCVSYDWLDIDSIRCEYKSDTDETNGFINDQVERERCA